MILVCARVRAVQSPAVVARPSSPSAPMAAARKPMKYVVVTGGVVSGLGKGITISSLGLLLKLSGIRVTSIKIDPYLVRGRARARGNDVCGTAVLSTRSRVYVHVRVLCGWGVRLFARAGGAAAAAVALGIGAAAGALAHCVVRPVVG